MDIRDCIEKMNVLEHEGWPDSSIAEAVVRADLSRHHVVDALIDAGWSDKRIMAALLGCGSLGGFIREFKSRWPISRLISAMRDGGMNDFQIAGLMEYSNCAGQYSRRIHVSFV